MWLRDCEQFSTIEWHRKRRHPRCPGGVGERLPRPQGGHPVGVTGRQAAATGAEPLWGGRQADGHPGAEGFPSTFSPETTSPRCPPAPIARKALLIPVTGVQGLFPARARPRRFRTPKASEPLGDTRCPGRRKAEGRASPGYQGKELATPGARQPDAGGRIRRVGSPVRRLPVGERPRPPELRSLPG
jgi:hypothetical protein